MRWLLVALFVACAACSTAPEPSLANAANSPEALARDVLRALAARDEPRLMALALSEDEFRAQVWPELPAARPERNLPVSYVWGDLHQKSTASLQLAMSRYGGQALELTAVEFGGPTTDYGSYQVHRDTIFKVSSGAGPQTLRLCGSLIHKSGRWKVFSYVVDE